MASSTRNVGNRGFEEPKLLFRLPLSVCYFLRKNCATLGLFEEFSRQQRVRGRVAEDFRHAGGEVSAFSEQVRATLSSLFFAEFAFLFGWEFLYRTRGRI